MQKSEFIPPKRKLKKLEVAKETAELPEDLKKLWDAVSACATTHNLLAKAHFPIEFMKAVHASLAFTAKLHEQSVEEALKHPDAKLIPELKEQLKLRKKAEKDGKTQ